MPITTPRRIARDWFRRAGRPFRRAPVRIAVSTLVVLATMAVTWSLLAQAEAGARRYGSARHAVVARRDLEPGEVIDDDTARVVELPGVAVPPRALRAASGQRVVDAVHRGQVVVDADVTGSRSALAAAIGPGRRAIAIGSDRVGLRLERGDVVDLWSADPSGSIVVIASAAEVIRVGSGAVTVAVAADEAGPVAAALVADIVVATLRPG